MYELLALLLPVAAASGWYAAKRAYAPDYRSRRAQDLNSSYTRGLEFMLQDQMDEALDLLCRTVQLDTDGWDLRLAIGNFFRRRGEVDKALAVHESLLAQCGLTDELRRRTLFELGVDYYAAGLLDRAEQIFVSLQEKEPFVARSLESLLNIYQREKDWEKAIDCVQELRKVAKPAHRETVAQFYCELAQQHVTGGRDDEAIRLTRSALQDDAECVRALLLLGRLLAKQDRWDEVQTILGRIERCAPAFLPDILELAVERYVRVQDEPGLQAYLQHLHGSCGCQEAAALLSDRLAATAGTQAATEYLVSAIAGSPSILLSRRLLDLLVSRGQLGDAALLKSIVSSLLDSIPSSDSRYLCSQCGFQGAEMHWKCPSCQTWEVVRPVTR
jgi:lipopolysaccharide biosynthesis regulator YciM